MKVSPSLLVAQLSLAAAVPTYTAAPSSKVLYFQENNPSGNSIVAVNVSQNGGTLSNAVRTSTGGFGLAELFAASQDSVKVVGNYLFTVNSGSNSVSFFVIDPKDPLHPRLIGKPAASLGHSPISVTYSEKLNIACTVNGNFDGPGVTCFNVDPVKGLSVAGPLRPIPPPKGGSTPPTNSPPLIISGDIRFNPSSTAVFTTVAGANNSDGSIFAYPVVNGNVSTKPVVSTLKDITIPFSLNFLMNKDSRLFVTNPHNGSPGALLGAVGGADHVSEAKVVTVGNQVASCWAAEAEAFGSLFIADAGRSVLSVLNSTTLSTKLQFSFTAPSAGSTDTVFDNQFIYTLTDPLNANLTAYVASPQILVFNVQPVLQNKKPVQVQSFDVFSAIGKVPGLQGLAKYPADSPN